METTNSPKPNLGIRFGVVLGAMVVVIGLIRYNTGMIFNEDQRLSYLYWGIFLLSTLYATYKTKNFNPREFTFKKALKLGLTIGLISSLMYFVYLMVLNYVIDPELSKQLLEITEQNTLAQNPELTADQLSDLKFKQESANPAVRGLIYIFTSMFFGGTYAGIAQTFMRDKRN